MHAFAFCKYRLALEKKACYLAFVPLMIHTWENETPEKPWFLYAELYCLTNQHFH
jgi:hypothetical protein